MGEYYAIVSMIQHCRIIFRKRPDKGIHTIRNM